MNEIDLRRFDLNLLIVFEVLMIERNVTRAAERLGRTQSAVSHSLSRLRKQLGDPLLIKAGVRMQPTAFALDLLEQARPLLRGMQRVLSPRQIFDPANSRRLFRVAAADFMQTMFSSLLTRLRSEAPGVCVEWVSPRDSSLLDLAEGQIDIAITQAPSRMPEGITGEAVGTLQWRCFAREGHPAFAEWGDASLDPVAASGHTGQRRSDEPGATGGVRRGSGADGRRMGAALLCYRADFGEFGPAGHDAGDHRGRDWAIRIGWRAGRCHFRLPRSRKSCSGTSAESGDPEIDVVARSVGPHHQKQICRRTDMIANTHAHRSLRLRIARRQHRAAAREPARFRADAGGAAATAVLRDRSVAELPHWLEPGDQLVVNDTKVIAAQLRGRRIGRETEPKIEATLIKRLDGSRWQALVKPAKKLAPGDVVRFGNEGKVCLLGHLDAQVEAKGEDGEITLSFSFHGPDARSGHRRSRHAAAAALHRLQAHA